MSLKESSKLENSYWIFLIMSDALQFISFNTGKKSSRTRISVSSFMWVFCKFSSSLSFSDFLNSVTNKSAK